MLMESGIKIDQYIYETGSHLVKTTFQSKSVISNPGLFSKGGSMSHLLHKAALDLPKLI